MFCGVDHVKGSGNLPRYYELIWDKGFDGEAGEAGESVVEALIFVPTLNHVW